MIQPPYLQKGDTIGIIAPARKISPEEMELAIKTFKDWGLNVKLGKNIYGSQDQYSGTDEQRAADLQEMLNDNDVKAVIAARGGYGVMRIIDKLNFSVFKKSPKWIVGFSDITILHSHINQNIGVETLHAVMSINFNKSVDAVESLRKALFGENLIYDFSKNPFNKGSDCNGVLIGGNLSLLYALKGSPSDIITDRKILFIEDLDEYLYHIDRMMLSLKRADKLSELEGLLVGGMTDLKDNAIPFGSTPEEIILDAVKEYEFPVYFNFPAGHISNNMALYLGRRIQIMDEGESITLFFS